MYRYGRLSIILHRKILIFMIRLLITVLITILPYTIWSETIDGFVVDEQKNALPYSTIKVKNKRLAVLSDSTGFFSIQHNEIKENDTVSISYLGYETRNIPAHNLIDNRDSRIELHPTSTELQEIMVVPSKKFKRKAKGKKHGYGLIKSCLDGKMAGECFGYEFHSKKNRRLILNKVGFFYCAGYKQMSRMKFRINVYDMSDVKKSPSSDFINVLSKPIFFDFNLMDSTSGKFEFILPESIVLPKDAMVEIEFLENLNDEIFYFKSNLIGKRTWAKSIIDGEWEQNPFATPFFIECIEI